MGAMEKHLGRDVKERQCYRKLIWLQCTHYQSCKAIESDSTEAPKLAILFLLPEMMGTRE